MPIETDFHSHLSKSSASQMVMAARAKGLRVLGLSEHIFEMTEARPLLVHMSLEGPLRTFDEYIDQVRTAGQAAQFDVRLGLEVDFIPETNASIQEFLKHRPWDFLIGSVHQVDGLLFERDMQLDKQVGEAIWLQYFGLLRQAVASGYFSLVSHPVRMRFRNPHVPESADQELEQLAAEASRHDVALEVNGQDVALYPRMVQRLIKACALHRTPTSVGSDAHLPDQLMRSHYRSEAFLREAGITTVRTWKQGQPEDYRF